jgi:Cu+-exporting ATPase
MTEPTAGSLRLDLPIAWHELRRLRDRIEKVLNRLPGVTASVNLARAGADRPLFAGNERTTDRRRDREGRLQRAAAHPELAIEGMSCAACSTRLEKLLNRLPGVDAVVNLASERATLRYLSRASSIRRC